MPDLALIRTFLATHHASFAERFAAFAAGDGCEPARLLLHRAPEQDRGRTEPLEREDGVCQG